MAVLGVEFLRFLDGRERIRHDREAETRHQEILDRISRAAMVATDRYDEKKVFPEYFPIDVSTDEVDYSQVNWDENIVFQVPSEDEREALRRMLRDDSVTISASSLAQPGPEQVLPDGSSVIEQIETDREWV